MSSSNRSRTLLALARHALCIVALMWTGLVNGQPFFFQSDSTNYIRAADVGVYLVSHHKLSTVWTDRYRGQLSSAQGKKATNTPQPSPRPIAGNDLSKGLIMGGRSPYIGALIYLGYVLGDFWPFVLFQAAVCYLLILLAARRFGVTKPAQVTVLTLGLAATTALPTYNSLLLADAFASFGILAFLLLATPGRWSRTETIFLACVLAISVVSHLTHLVMLGGMLVAMAIIYAFRWIPRPPRRAWVYGAGALLVGIASISATSLATKIAFGRGPQMLPLLTARFIADGPGKSFIDSGCDHGRFEICRVPIGNPNSDALILFGKTPANGAYMLASADQRRAMGEQDVPFAIAVLKHDPAGELFMMARNTIRQLLWIDYDGLNQNCFNRPDCWETVPEPVRAKLRNTPSGRGDWPQDLMNGILYAVVLASLLSLVLVSRAIARCDPERWIQLRCWLLLIFAAMIVCAVLGGAVADPQYRYQGRLIWLLPLLAGIALIIRRQISAAGAPTEHALAAPPLAEPSSA